MPGVTGYPSQPKSSGHGPPIRSGVTGQKAWTLDCHNRHFYVMPGVTGYPSQPKTTGHGPPIRSGVTGQKPWTLDCHNRHFYVMPGVTGYPSQPKSSGHGSPIRSGVTGQKPLTVDQVGGDRKDGLGCDWFVTSTASKNRCAHPHHSAALGNGGVQIGAHAHRQSVQRQALAAQIIK